MTDHEAALSRVLRPTLAAMLVAAFAATLIVAFDKAPAQYRHDRTAYGCPTKAC